MRTLLWYNNRAFNHNSNINEFTFTGPLDSREVTLTWSFFSFASTMYRRLILLVSYEQIWQNSRQHAIKCLLFFSQMSQIFFSPNVSAFAVSNDSESMAFFTDQNAKPTCSSDHELTFVYVVISTYQVWIQRPRQVLIVASLILLKFPPTIIQNRYQLPIKMAILSQHSITCLGLSDSHCISSRGILY